MPTIDQLDRLREADFEFNLSDTEIDDEYSVLGAGKYKEPLPQETEETGVSLGYLEYDHENKDIRIVEIKKIRQ